MCKYSAKRLVIHSSWIFMLPHVCININSFLAWHQASIPVLIRLVFMSRLRPSALSFWWPSLHFEKKKKMKLLKQDPRAPAREREKQLFRSHCRYTIHVVRWIHSYFECRHTRSLPPGPEWWEPPFTGDLRATKVDLNPARIIFQVSWLLGLPACLSV